MMRRFDRVVTPDVKAGNKRAVPQTLQDARIGSSGPEGQGWRAQHRAPRCGAVAGKSTHAPMT